MWGLVTKLHFDHHCNCKQSLKEAINIHWFPSWDSISFSLYVGMCVCMYVCRNVCTFYSLHCILAYFPMWNELMALCCHEVSQILLWDDITALPHSYSLSLLKWKEEEKMALLLQKPFRFLLSPLLVFAVRIHSSSYSDCLLWIVRQLSIKMNKNMENEKYGNPDMSSHKRASETGTKHKP